MAPQNLVEAAWNRRLTGASRALKIFADAKSKELEQVLSDQGPDIQKAFKASVLDPLQADAPAVIKDIINWTPNTGGGIFGHNQDDNAMDYYEQANKTQGGLRSLTITQRVRLLTHILDGATWGDEEDAGLALLTTASDADAHAVIRTIGWARCQEELDNAPLFPFSSRYPRDEVR